MDQQSYTFELMDQTPHKVEMFNDQLIHPIVKTITKLEMITPEQFAENEKLFIAVLREVFTTMFKQYFKVTLEGKYHPPTDKRGPRYDIGLTIGGGDEGIYPIQIELIGKPSDSTTLH